MSELFTVRSLGLRLKSEPEAQVSSLNPRLKSKSEASTPLQWEVFLRTWLETSSNKSGIKLALALFGTVLFKDVQVSKLRLTNPEKWLPSPLVRHPGKSGCDYSLYTPEPDIRQLSFL
ncbi:hypothetical protein Fot_25736 [Forsythia ovata]|uniref:Uncharacterized protein n=1 Tax=Forsythia ovata TaxID=205694 RepID=A0ABD1UAM9_9LAMI